MADAYTTAAMYGNADPQPDPGNSPPEMWTSDDVDADGVKGLVARMATGQLNDQDDFKRVMGELGDTKDHVELHKAMVAETGGPRPNTPVTNPTKTAVDPKDADVPVTHRQLPETDPKPTPPRKSVA